MHSVGVIPEVLEDEKGALRCLGWNHVMFMANEFPGDPRHYEVVVVAEIRFSQLNTTDMINKSIVFVQKDLKICNVDSSFPCTAI